MKFFQPHLLSAILREPWAISEDHAMALAPLLSSVFTPNLEFDAKEPIQPSSIAVSVTDGNDSSEEQSHTINVITISGALTKQTQMCGPAGMALIGEWVQRADADPSIDGHLFKFDTPGGTVVGTEELGNIIKNCKKPTLAYIDDLCCSAGYWLASNCNEIVANNTTAEVGSIGVLLSFADVQPAYEKMGVVFHTITAPQSTDKVTRYAKLRAGDYTDYQNEVLKPLGDKFIHVVKSNRGNLDEKQFFTGKVFHAQDVVGTLIDSIKTFDQALHRLAEMCDRSSNSNSKTTTMQLPMLAKATGVDEFESSDGSIVLSETMASAVEAVLTSAEQTNASLQQQLQERADQGETVATQATRITELEARIAELEQEPGAQSATATKDADGAGASGGEEHFYGRLHRLTNS